MVYTNDHNRTTPTWFSVVNDDDVMTNSDGKHVYGSDWMISPGPSRDAQVNLLAMGPGARRPVADRFHPTRSMDPCTWAVKPVLGDPNVTAFLKALSLHRFGSTCTPTTCQLHVAENSFTLTTYVSPFKANSSANWVQSLVRYGANVTLLSTVAT